MSNRAAESKVTIEKSSYRQIFKATSIFGGVQFINVILFVIRAKFVAVLLGPSGMGVSGLLTSTISFIGLVSSFGLSASAVRNIAAAYNSGNSEQVGQVVGTLRRLVWITGVSGFLITFFAAPWLSQLTFGSKDYTWAFVAISITLLLNQISAGQKVILQGFRKIGLLAKASLLGTVLGLITSIPLYYFFGIGGIPPAIIITSLSALSLSYFFAKKVEFQQVKLDRKMLFSEGKDMLGMGIVLSVSNAMTLGVDYASRIFLSNYGGVMVVGLYSAGFAIINSYVSMVFTAMGTDYYPRLSAVANDHPKFSKVINHQAEIAVLVISPLVASMIIFIKWIIIIVLSPEFLPIAGMMAWVAMGMYFKALSWPLGFSVISKGDKKIFFWKEFFVNIVFLGFNILGYLSLGLTGLGIAFLGGYLIDLILMILISRIRYNFTYSKVVYQAFGVTILLSTLIFTWLQILSLPYSLVFGITILVATIWYSINKLNDRLNFLELLKRRV